MAYLILDLEMTGTKSGYHEIIQIGAVLADNNWNQISEFESLVYPNNPQTVSKYSEEIHGISLADLDDAPLDYEVIEDFENWIRKNLRKDPFQNLRGVIPCGQSVINDINFLRTKYDELNLEWPFSSKMIDLLSISFIFFQIFDNNGIKKPKSMSLQSIAKMFNIEREEDTHNALEDAKITYLCFKEYLKMAKSFKVE